MAGKKKQPPKTRRTEIRHKSVSAEPEPNPQPKPEQSPKPTSIVGVGASAGGLEAFEQLLRAMPVDTGMAFVLVQHLAPRHESILSELLGRSTKMPVNEVHEGTAVQPNRVYVIPPNKDMSITEGVLHLTPLSPDRA